MSEERGAYKLAPEVVFIDARVARTMPEENPDGALLGYIRQDLYEADVRKAAGWDDEAIVQLLTNPDGHLCALSNKGRVWAFFSEEKDMTPRWIVVAEGLPKEPIPPGRSPKPPLDS